MRSVAFSLGVDFCLIFFSVLYSRHDFFFVDSFRSLSLLTVSVLVSSNFVWVCVCFFFSNCKKLKLCVSYSFTSVLTYFHPHVELIITGFHSYIPCYSRLLIFSSWLFHGISIFVSFRLFICVQFFAYYTNTMNVNFTNELKMIEENEIKSEKRDNGIRMRRMSVFVKQL